MEEYTNRVEKFMQRTRLYRIKDIKNEYDIKKNNYAKVSYIYRKFDIIIIVQQYLQTKINGTIYNVVSKENTMIQPQGEFGCSDICIFKIKDITYIPKTDTNVQQSVYAVTRTNSIVSFTEQSQLDWCSILYDNDEKPKEQITTINITETEIEKTYENLPGYYSAFIQHCEPEIKYTSFSGTVIWSNKINDTTQNFLSIGDVPILSIQKQLQILYTINLIIFISYKYTNTYIHIYNKLLYIFLLLIKIIVQIFEHIHLDSKNIYGYSSLPLWLQNITVYQQMFYLYNIVVVITFILYTICSSISNQIIQNYWYQQHLRKFTILIIIGWIFDQLFFNWQQQKVVKTKPYTIEYEDLNILTKQLNIFILPQTLLLGINFSRYVPTISENSTYYTNQEYQQFQKIFPYYFQAYRGYLFASCFQSLFINLLIDYKTTYISYLTAELLLFYFISYSSYCYQKLLNPVQDRMIASSSSSELESTTQYTNVPTVTTDDNDINTDINSQFYPQSEDQELGNSTINQISPESNNKVLWHGPNAQNSPSYVDTTDIDDIGVPTSESGQEDVPIELGPVEKQLPLTRRERSDR